MLDRVRELPVATLPGVDRAPPPITEKTPKLLVEVAGERFLPSAASSQGNGPGSTSALGHLGDIIFEQYGDSVDQREIYAGPVGGF